jgi:hypothetical protein
MRHDMKIMCPYCDGSSLYFDDQKHAFCGEDGSDPCAHLVRAYGITTEEILADDDTGAVSYQHPDYQLAADPYDLGEDADSIPHEENENGCAFVGPDTYIVTAVYALEPLKFLRAEHRRRVESARESAEQRRQAEERRRREQEAREAVLALPGVAEAKEKLKKWDGNGGSYRRLFKLRNGYLEIWPIPGKDCCANICAYVPNTTSTKALKRVFDGVAGWTGIFAHVVPNRLAPMVLACLEDDKGTGQTIIDLLQDEGVLPSSLPCFDDPR